MHTLSSALTLAFALASAVSTATPAHASDKKIGNVIAVERTLHDVYQSCIDQMKVAEAESTFASCALNSKKTSADFSFGTQKILGYTKNSCSVEALVAAGVVLVTFQNTAAKATVEDSKLCLRKALDASANKDSFKFMAFTVE